MVVKRERELEELERKVMAALGMGDKEEKVDETMVEEVENPALDDVRIGDHPAVEGPGVPEVRDSSQPQADCRISP